MLRQLRPAVMILALMTLLTGVIYPLVVTAAAQVLFPAQANGSLVTINDTVVGSSLIGQNWNDDPRYFWSRPSAVNYNPLPSSGSNLAPTSATLQEAVNTRATAFTTANSMTTALELVPTDMLFASGSGLDPHISPETARLQVRRVAANRGIEQDILIDLVNSMVEMPQLGLLGQERVNVLLLNLVLDALE